MSCYCVRHIVQNHSSNYILDYQRESVEIIQNDLFPFSNVYSFEFCECINFNGDQPTRI